MEQQQAIKAALDHVANRPFVIDKRKINAVKMAATGPTRIFPFEGEIWVVRLPFVEEEDCVETPGEIIVIASDSTGELCTLRGL